MMHHGTTDCVCLLPFNFKDATYIDISTSILDYGMGLTVEYFVECSLNIIFELTTIDVILDHISDNVFPEHVPNDSVNTCLKLCIETITYFISKIIRFRQYLELVMVNICSVKLIENNSTLSINFNMSRTIDNEIYNSNRTGNY